MEAEVTERMLGNCYRAAGDMKKRILEGEVIADVIYGGDGSRILVTKTSNNKYGYAVFEDGSNEPCYLLEGDYLLEDLQKATDYRGQPLVYAGAKSMLEKNMIGIFSEYKIYPDCHEYYISLKTPEDSSVAFKQMMAGFNPQYPVTLVSASFDRGTFTCAALADTLFDDKTNMFIVELGTGFLKPDGTVDYERCIEGEIEAQSNRIYYGEEPITEEEAKRIVEEQVIQAQTLLTPMYEQIGLPLMDGIEYLPLLDIGLRGGNISQYITDEGKLAIDSHLLTEGNSLGEESSSIRR